MATPVITTTVPVTLLRAGGVLLGLYGYVVTLWLAKYASHPAPVAAVREWVVRPLGLGEDFGPLGVMLLLVCAGWTAERLSPWRVLLPAVVASALAVAGEWLGLTDVTTVGGVLAPLAWIAGAQVIGWLIALDRRTWPAVVATLVATGVLSVLAPDSAGRPLLFLPLVLAGLVVRRVLDGALPSWAGVLLGAGCVGAVAGADLAFPALAQWWYPVAATYAVLLFLVAVHVPGATATAAAVAAHPVTRWLADRAEWLLLLGGVAGFAVLGALRWVVPVPVGMVVALAVTAVAADLCHRATRRALP
ncbi:hypothetical protein [Actinophytocola sp. KF-1]